MNGEKSDSSSKYDLFLGRMTALNQCFLRFMINHLEEFPGSDLTPTINSYLKHVSELDKTYSEDAPKTSKEPISSTLSTISTTSRKRALPPSFELRSFGNKKAAIRQEENGVETIVPASKEATNQPEIVKPNPSLVVTSIFGIKQNETKSSEASVPIFPLFSQQEKSGIESISTKLTERRDENGTKSLFSLPTKSNLSQDLNGSKPFQFGLTPPSSQEKSLFSTFSPFSLFSNPPASQEKNSVPMFPIFSTAASSRDKINESSTSTDTKQDDLQDENEEPPKVEIVEQKEPGALFFMKSAVYNYKDKKWEKIGVGYVNVMSGEDQKNNKLLIRAANTLGTIWVNTYIAEHFKAFLKADKAMTIRFPDVSKDGKTTVVQYLLKSGNTDEMKQLATHLNANVI